MSLEPTPFTFDASLALEALVGVGLSIMGADDAAAGRLPWTLERAHAQLHLLQKRLGEPPEFAPTTRALRSDLEALSELMRDADKEPLAPALGGRVLATALVVLSHLALFEPASTQAGESMALAAPAPWTPPGEG